MLALFAGTGDLPAAVMAGLKARGVDYVVCEMRGFPVAGVGWTRKIGYRIETLGSLFEDLRGRGVTEVCFAGAIRRPDIDPAAIDAATLPLVPLVQEAMAKGDDGALRGIIGLFEEQGFAVVAAQDLAPDLLPPAGVLVGGEPDAKLAKDLAAAMARHAEMSAQDEGQALIANGGRIVASEGPEGTDAMLSAFASDAPVRQYRTPRGGIAGFVDTFFGGLFGGGNDWTGEDNDVELLPAYKGLLYKAPKLGQDRRADLPVIGPQTIEWAARCGIANVVIEAGGVMVMDRAEVERLAQLYGMRLWVREAAA